MKKKILVACLCVALAVLTIAGTTLAYLTDSKEVKNTFTVGKVKIALDEAKVDTDGTPIAGEKRVTENEYKLMPGHTYTKDPTVTVLEGSEDCYVRLKVTFTNFSKLLPMMVDPAVIDGWHDEWDEEIDAETLTVLRWTGLHTTLLNIDPDTTVWSSPFIGGEGTLGFDEAIKNAKYCVIDEENDTATLIYYYMPKIGAVDKDTALATLFDTITLPGWIDADGLEALKGFQINVVAEAIQADGFADADEAWAAFPTK